MPETAGVLCPGDRADTCRPSTVPLSYVEKGKSRWLAGKKSMGQFLRVPSTHMSPDRTTCSEGKRVAWRNGDLPSTTRTIRVPYAVAGAAGTCSLHALPGAASVSGQHPIRSATLRRSRRETKVHGTPAAQPPRRVRRIGTHMSSLKCRGKRQ